MQSGTNLEKLRTWMKANKIEAIHVPREDMFGGEYVAACDERLAWVSGFTGSAGLAIITTDEAYLFVDGRYTLQAKAQASDFEIHPLSQPEIFRVWECLEPASLHYDPWLMSVKQLKSWSESISLKPIKQNPIDILWTDRPAPDCNQAYDYPIEYAGKSREEKLAWIRSLIGKNKKEDTAIFLSNAESVCWLINIRGADLPHVPLLQCMALITKEGITLFCDPGKIFDGLTKTLNVKIVPFEKMRSTINALRTTIVADSTTTPSALLKKSSYLEFQRNIIFKWQTDPCELAKAKKDLTEQKGMRQCHIRDALAIIRFWKWLEEQESVTEIQAQDQLGIFRSQIDLYQGDSFATISGFGFHGAIVHYRATPKTDIPLGHGIYLLDSGGQYLDGTTDITRTFAIGEPTQAQKEHYTLVLKGHIALANIKFPIGTTGAQLDALARQYLWEQGLDYAHATGHGVGSFLNVHEGPQGISKARHTVLEPGMVVSNEPGLYLEGEYGIRIENLQIVTKSLHDNFLCFESLTLVPYDPALIERKLLTTAEQNWLKNYYDQIKTLVAQKLDKVEKTWLLAKLKSI